MTTLPTDRTTDNTEAEHVSDHNILHAQHNSYEGTTPSDFVAVTGHDDADGQAIAGGFQIVSDVTFTADPTGFSGVPLYLKQDMELNYTNGVIGPSSAPGYEGPEDTAGGVLPFMSGPRGWFNIEGTQQYDVSCGLLGMALPIQTFNVYKNSPAQALNLGSFYTAGFSPQMLADGATVGWTAGEYPEPPGAAGDPILPLRNGIGVVDNQYYGTINGGVGNWGTAYSIGYHNVPMFHGNVTFGTRIDFFASEMYLDSDGTNTPDVAEHFGMYIQPLSLASDKNIGIWIDGERGPAPGSGEATGLYCNQDAFVGGTLNLGGEGPFPVVVNLIAQNAILTHSGTQINFSSTISYATTSNMFNTFINYAPTFTWSVAPLAGVVMDSAYANAATYKNNSAAVINLSPVFSFAASYTKTLDTQTNRNVASGTGDVDFLSAPIYTRANSGTFNQGIHVGFKALPVINGTGCTLTTDTAFTCGLTVTAGTVTTRTGFLFVESTGTVTTQRAIDIPALTNATTNVGIQNLASLLQKGAVVLTPTTVTVTSNAGTVPVTASNASFTNSSAATMAITIATSGATDGQDLYVRVYDFSAAAQTIGWTNTENGEASVPTTSNGVTTTPKTVHFMYNSATSKWRCIP